METNKIAFVFDGLNVGGIETVGITYIKLLKEKGITVDVYNLNPKKNHYYGHLKDYAKIYDYSHTRYHVIENYDMKFKNNRLWKVSRPFIVLPLKIHFMLKKRIPIKYDIVIAFSGHFNDLHFITSKKIDTSKRIAWLHGGLKDYYEISENFIGYYKKIKNLVVLTGSTNCEVAKDLNVKKIYNPVEFDRDNIDFEKVNHLKQKYGKFLMMVARFSKQKDHLSLIKAYYKLYKEFNFTEKLLFLGDGPTINEVIAKVNELNLENQIIFIGAVDDAQNYYEACYLTTLSSPAEGLPTVLIESMFFKKPVVATNALPGVPEILNSKDIGIICDVGDYECLAESIYYLYHNDNTYQRFSDNSYKRSMDFSYNECIRSFIAFLKKLY